MECYCYETDSAFIFCVEGAESAQLEDVIQHAGWVKTDGRFLLSYSRHEFTPREKELAGKNFSRSGQAMFESMLLGFDWEKPLELLARKFNENEIEWYIVGSVCDAVRGAAVKPGDMDIVVHTRDFIKAKEICCFNFPDAIILPFLENQKLCPLRSFGRMFLAGAMVEIAADDSWNMENRRPEYEKAVWRGYDVFMESLRHRYQIEIARNRTDRIKAINEYIAAH